MYRFKSLSFISFLTKTNLIFGQYHDVECSLFKKIMFHLYSFSLVTAITLYSLTYAPFTQYVFLPFLFFTISEFILNTFLSIFIKGNSLKKAYSLSKKLRNLIDLQHLTITRNFLSVRITLFLFHTLKIVSAFNYSFDNLAVFILLFATTSTFITYTSKLLIFDFLYQIVKQIRNKIEYKYATVNVIGKDRVQYKIDIIKKCIIAYSYTLDYFDSVCLEIQSWVMMLFH